MQKREREIRAMAQRCGLHVVDGRVADNGLLRVVLQAPNGMQRAFTFSMRAGWDRHAKNDEADIRRWRREVCPDVPPPPSAFNAAFKAVLERTKPAAPPEVPAAPAAQPPAIEPTPAPLRLVHTSVEGNAVMPTKTGHKQQLSFERFYELTEWMKSQLPFKAYVGRGELAERAEKAVGFRVTDYAIEQAFKALKVQMPPSPTPTHGYAAAQVVARELVSLLKELDLPVSRELQSLARLQEAA